MLRIFFLLSAAGVVCASGCAGRQGAPTLSSSASATSYAQAFPDEIELHAAQLADDKAEVQRLSGELPGRAQTIKSNEHGALLLEIVEKADAAGRGEGFSHEHDEARTIRLFANEERGPISARVGNATQLKITNEKCENVEVSGVVGYALKDAIDKQLEKRLRAHNEAHLLIERHKTTLGAPVVPVVQKLADDIAVASYLAYVALPRDRDVLQHRVGQEDEIASTLDDAIEDEQTYYRDKARTDPERRASEDRTVALTRSRTLLEPAAAHAKEELKQIDKQIELAQTDYTTALKDLKDALAQRTP